MTGMIHTATNMTLLAQKWKMVWLFLSLPWFKKRGPAHGAQYSLLALAPHCPLIPTCMCTDRGTAALLWRLPSSCAPVWKVCNWCKKEDKNPITEKNVHIKFKSMYHVGGWRRVGVENQNCCLPFQRCLELVWYFYYNFFPKKESCDHPARTKHSSFSSFLPLLLIQTK